MTGFRFDPAADFLLDLAWPNLYEPVHAAIEAGHDRYRCKGCRAVVTPGQREWHWVDHRTATGRTPKAAA